MTARQDITRTDSGGAPVEGSRRSWAPPQVRRLATSAAETGAGAGFDLDETPS